MAKLSISIECKVPNSKVVDIKACNIKVGEKRGVMVDFDNLSYEAEKEKPTDPLIIFERLVKPEGINDLYSSQREVLKKWYNESKDSKDAVIKLHTGGGKTLIGLLIGLSSMRELHKPSLYLTPTNQLVEQTIEQARQIGIPAIPYQKGQPLARDFINGNAIMVGTYNSLFNAKSKFGSIDSKAVQELGTIIFDDAHASFPIIRDCFTLEISSKTNTRLYSSLTQLFEDSFKEIHREGTFEDIIGRVDYGVLEVPYWSWHDKSSQVATLIRDNKKQLDPGFTFSWPLLRDNLNLCHALISPDKFTITSMLPLVEQFPAFVNADRRVYMSANINDTSEIVRTFDATPELVEATDTSKTLAGVSEKMILLPEKVQSEVNPQEFLNQILEKAKSKKFGSIILVPSNEDTERWASSATIAKGSKLVEQFVKELQSGKDYGPFVFANRYDGVDLPGDACRVLIMSGLPIGSSNYDKFKATVLRGSQSLTREIAQKIEQGIGRGVRGSSDYCVVFLVDHELVNWVSIKKNMTFLTNITRAQLEIANTVSEAISDSDDLADTVDKCFDRNESWTKFYRKALSDNLTDDVQITVSDEALVERRVINLWYKGHRDKAIDKLTTFLGNSKDTLDSPTKGWLEHLCSKIHYDNNNVDDSEQLQKRAYGHNPNLNRSREEPEYYPRKAPDNQAKAIASYLSEFTTINAAIREFDIVTVPLVQPATSKEFEQALCDFAHFIGFEPEKHDRNGKGPDVVWLAPPKTGFILEAKNEKKADAPFHKQDAGQLNVAINWFKKEYKQYTGVPVSVHPSNCADNNAEADVFKLLTLKDLKQLVSDTHKFLVELESLEQPPNEMNCQRLLERFRLEPEGIKEQYLSNFKVSKP